ncbi:MAG: hypothetical protein ACMV1K_01420 [Sulfurospirillum sp.]
MGKVVKEVEEMIEDVLGLNDDLEGSLASEHSEEGEESSSETRLEGDATSNTAPYIMMTNEQVKIQSEIIKLDSKIDKLKEDSSVNTDDFYNHLEDYLSDEEQQLEIEDRPAYLKLISKKEKEFIAKHSNNDEIRALEERKSDFENMNRIQEGILEVTRAFPEYNHEKMMAFFKEELSAKEQHKIYEASQNFADVYKNTYQTYLERNPSNIRKGTSSTLPNVNNARRQSITTGEINDGLESEEEKLKSALGL